MNLTTVPTTKLGKWSVCLWIAALILFVIVFASLIFSAKDELSQSFFKPLWAAIVLLVAGACEGVAFVFGVVDIARNKGRSILVFLSVLTGLFVLVFFIGEFLFSH